MNKMIIYRTTNGMIYVPCDTKNLPDLSRVPKELRMQLYALKWDVYSISTSKDKEIFTEVKMKGFSLQKVIVTFSEQS